MLDESLPTSAVVHVTNTITALIESNLFEDFYGSMVSILFRSIEFLDSEEYNHLIVLNIVGIFVHQPRDSTKLFS